MKIKHLPLDQAHKIAAGEVVERPANIVKELLENSIDAGATAITLAIEDGGKALIRVTDNGCGMSPEDARICFDKHATSKLTSIDELESISTFGFRGEALASVAAIAQVTLITKEAQTIEGIKLHVANSTILSEEPCAAPTGTEISVADLFYNVPARKKFLKKRETEWRHIHQLFQAFCLDYPHIHFKLFSEDKLIANCPPMDNLSDRFKSVCELAPSAILIDFAAERSDHHLTLSGVTSDHQIMRFDRSGIFLFVNKRWIKNHELVRALLKGYQNVIPNGRYPVACLNITIDPKSVDVNIHPRKEEVKFMHPGVVENLVTAAIKDGLEKTLSRQIKREVRFASADMPGWQSAHYQETSEFSSTVRPAAPGVALREAWERARETEQNSLTQTNHFSPVRSDLSAIAQGRRLEELRDQPASSVAKYSEDYKNDQENFFNQINHPSTVRPDTSRAQYARPLSSMPGPSLRGARDMNVRFPSHAQDERWETSSLDNTNPIKFAAQEIFAENSRRANPEAHQEVESNSLNNVQILCQYNKTYILIEQESGLLFIDQHAAHERILYEQFRNNFENIATVSLLFPQLIGFSKHDLAQLEPHLPFINRQGIHAEIFAEDQLKITAIPVHLKNASIEELLKEILTIIAQNNHTNPAELAKVVHEKVHAQMACKAAVKAGDTLSHEQMVQLITDLNKTPNRFSCPHGRPTSWALNLDELEKKFKRDYRTY